MEWVIKAMPGVGSGPSSITGIDLGLPIFLGRDVVVAFETSTIVISGTDYQGPFWAF